MILEPCVFRVTMAELNVYVFHGEYQSLRFACRAHLIFYFPQQLLLAHIVQTKGFSYTGDKLSLERHDSQRDIIRLSLSHELADALAQGNCVVPCEGVQDSGHLQRTCRFSGSR